MVMIETEDGKLHTIMEFNDFVELVDEYLGVEARDYLNSQIAELQEIISFLKDGGDPEEIDDWEGDAY